MKPFTVSEDLRVGLQVHWVPVTGRTGGNCGSGWGCVAQTGVPCQDLHPLCRRKPAEAADPRSVTEDVPQSFSIIPKTHLEKDGQRLACPPEGQGKRRGRGAAGLTQQHCPPTSAKGAHTCLCTHTHPCSSPWSPDCPPAAPRKQYGVSSQVGKWSP